MGSPLEVRDTTDADAASLQQCLDGVARERRWLAMTAAPPVEAVASFRRQLRADGGVDLVAVDADGRVAGWIDIQRAPWDGMRHVGTLGMGIRADHRHHGLGRVLLSRALADARARGVTRVQLEVFASNAAAVRLYEASGFLHEGRKVGARILDGVTDDILVMAFHARG